MHLEYSYVTVLFWLSSSAFSPLHVHIYTYRLFILSFAPCLSASSSCLSTWITASGCSRAFCAVTDLLVRKRSSEDRRSFTLDHDSSFDCVCASSSSAYNNDPLRLTHASRLSTRGSLLLSLYIKDRCACTVCGMSIK